MPALHRFEHAGRRYVIDPESCFCFECDAISWDVLEHFPDTPANRILHLLEDRHPRREIDEVLGELEWLRTARSILQPPDLKKRYDALDREAGLHTLVGLELPAARIAGAAAFLLARSGVQRALTLELRYGRALPADAAALAAACARALRAAKVAGKMLTVSVRACGIALRRPPAALAPHALDAAIEMTDAAQAAERLERFARSGLDDLGRLAKALVDGAPCGRIVLRPGGVAFAPAVEALDGAGFAVIGIDLDAAYARTPPQALLDGMREAAEYYAKRLLRQHYFRLDPIADLFWRIYNGTPIVRHDPAGAGLLAVDAAGDVYPSPAFAGRPAMRLGNLDRGDWDDAPRGPFLDAGVLTAPECMRCWARHLCGGGTLEVHHALGGALRPHAPWCNAQRAWLQTAVAAFSLLSGAGVDFARVYHNLTPAPRPSLWQMAKAAFSLHIGMRPLAEADAPLLQRWENWSDAACFTLAPGGLMMATRYDREMDAIHPNPLVQEFLLLRKNGKPMGLLKVAPDTVPGAARAALYLRRTEDYADEAVRKSFRFLLGEAASRQALHRIAIAAGPGEDALAGFLEACGFRYEGAQREALYLHGQYHPVRWYGFTLDAA